MKKKLQKSLVATCASFACIASSAAQDEKDWELSLAAMWDSKYVTEGIDNLPDGSDGLGSGEVALSYAGFTGAIWYANGIDTSYDEWNFGIEYAWELGPVTIAPSYTYLLFPEDDADTSELGLGVEWEAVDNLTIGGGLVWDAEAEGDGFWLEASIGYGIDLIEEVLSITPYGLIGYDLGYVSAEVDDFNNVQAGVEAAWAFAPKWELFGQFSHSWALENVEAEGLGDVTWGSVGLAVTF